MVHLYSAYTDIEDVEKSYSISRLESLLDYIRQDHETLDKLKSAIFSRLSDLDNLEVYQVVTIKKSYTDTKRIRFYVSRDLYVKDTKRGGKEVQVGSYNNKSFLWREKKEAFEYADQLAHLYCVPVRDLTKEFNKKGIHTYPEDQE